MPGPPSPPPPPRRLYIDRCIIFFSLNITIARDSISGVTRFACTNMGSCSVSAYSIHVTVVGFGSAFVNIWGELRNRLVASLLSLCDALSRYIPYLHLSYFHFMGKAWPIKLTFYNVNNFIAYVAGVERGRGQGGRQKGGGMGAG